MVVWDRLADLDVMFSALLIHEKRLLLLGCRDAHMAGPRRIYMGRASRDQARALEIHARIQNHHVSCVKCLLQQT